MKLQNILQINLLTEINDSLPIRGFFFFLIIWAALPGYGESTWISRLFRPSDGLAYQVVRDIAQTPDGSVWFATWGGGLSRFDGSQWKTINEEKNVSDYMIRCLACDGRGGLWAGTAAGIKYYDGQQWKLFSIQTVPQLEKDSVFSILIRQNGEIWFAMEKGFLYSYNPDETGTKQWTLLRNPESFDNSDIRCLIELDDGSVWVGGKQTYRYDRGQWEDYPVSQYVRSFCAVKGGRLFAAALDSLFEFNGKQWDGIKNSPPNPRGIVQMDDGSIVVGTIVGIFIYQNGNWKSFELLGDSSSPYVEVIRTLDNGSIWIGTRNGAYLLRQSDWSVFNPPIQQSSFRAENFLCSPQISPRYVKQTGKIISPASNKWETIGTLKQHNSDIINYLHQDKDRISIHKDDSFTEYSLNNLSPVRSTPIPESLNHLKGYQTSDGTFWLYGTEGLFSWTESGWRLYEWTVQEKNKRIQRFKETRDGTLWIVNHERVYAIGKEYPFLDIFTTPRNTGHVVTDICIDRNGAIWFATSGVGIFVYDGEKVTNYTSRNGLPSDWILCLYEASDGAVWAGMDNSTAASFRDGRWITFSQKEIRSKGRIDKISEDCNGSIWFAINSAGLVKYTPSTNAPETVIDVYPKDIVPRGMGIFSFHGWDAWHMTPPDELVYSWRIFNNHNGKDIVPWTQFQSLETVNSPPLNPGKYVFEVRTADKERNVDPTPASILFSVEPYFFMKPGFLIPVFFLLVLLLVSLLVVYLKNQALRESEKWLSRAQQMARIGHWIADLPGNKLLGSDEAYRILGTSPDAVQGSYKSYLHFVHPDDRKRVRQNLRPALKENKPLIFDHRIIQPGGLSRTIQVQGEIVINDSGRPIRMMGTIQDITDKKRSEENAQRVQKLEAVGVLAGGIAHDFNNILTAVSGNISLAKRSLNSGDKIYQRLTESEKATYRAHDLTMKLIAFGESGKPVKKKTSLEDLVKNSALIALSDSKSQCLFDIPAPVEPIEIDRRQISQVIQNIVKNASQSMQGEGRITIRIKNVTMVDESRNGLPEGKYIAITVEDAGCGIPPGHLPKIFDPYFTTKDAITQKGMGLGLAICFAIVKQHKGHIEAESEPGIGSKFHIFLPVFASNAG